MSITDITQFSDLWGGWSTFAALAGLFGALVSFLSRHPRLLSPEDGDAVCIIGALPWLMGLFALFIVFLTALSMGSSGPVPWEVRAVRRFDIRFAALIAFAFGFVFAFDMLRFRELRNRPSTWLCIAIYAFIAAMIVSTMWSYRYETAA
ncbi:MAG: hypothetical protein H0X66_22350 [Verrucomicrobia bacterium]|nr:hypothetical protein [Verrucomicrobiota bacterium]